MVNCKIKETINVKIEKGGKDKKWIIQIKKQQNKSLKTIHICNDVTYK